VNIQFVVVYSVAVDARYCGRYASSHEGTAAGADKSR